MIFIYYTWIAEIDDDFKMDIKLTSSISCQAVIDVTRIPFFLFKRQVVIIVYFDVFLSISSNVYMRIRSTHL